MRIDGAGLRVLTREECLAMLATVEVGRIGVSTQALPLIFPVCFAMDDDQIVISTQRGTTLDASTRGTVVAFEADGPSSHSKVGWSVQSTGIARHVTDPIELDRLAALALPSWSLTSPAQLVTITTEQLSGRLGPDTCRRGRDPPADPRTLDAVPAMEDVRPWPGRPRPLKMKP